MSIELHLFIDTNAFDVCVLYVWQMFFFCFFLIRVKAKVKELDQAVLRYGYNRAQTMYDLNFKRLKKRTVSNDSFDVFRFFM